MSSERESRDSESSPDPDDEVTNTFANDGSFLEMFKKRMEEQKRLETTRETKPLIKTEPVKSTITTTTASSSTPTSTTSTSSSVTDVQKASVNKPYQVVQVSALFFSTHTNKNYTYMYMDLAHFDVLLTLLPLSPTCSLSFPQTLQPIFLSPSTVFILDPIPLAPPIPLQVFTPSLSLAPDNDWWWVVCIPACWVRSSPAIDVYRLSCTCLSSLYTFKPFKCVCQKNNKLPV